MAQPKFCPYCERKVMPVKKEFSWPFFLVTSLFFGLGLLYPIIYMCKRRTRCPQCGCKI